MGDALLCMKEVEPMNEILYAIEALATIASFAVDLVELIQKNKQKDDAILEISKRLAPTSLQLSRRPPEDLLVRMVASFTGKSKSSFQL